MTFENFCLEMWLNEKLRQPFRDYLGNKANGIMSYSEWYYLYQNYQVELFRQRRLKNENH